MRSASVVLRFIGLAILVILLWRIDRQALADLLRQADWRFVALAVGLNLPLVVLKAMRWRGLLRAQQISYGIGRATLAYFGSIFIGLLTPGRLGEFVKTLHVSQDCGISTGRAFASVLADRLCDVYFLLVVGAMAVWSGMSWRTAEDLSIILVLGVLLTLPLVVLRCGDPVSWLRTLSQCFSQPQGRLLASVDWLGALQESLEDLTFKALLRAGTITVLAYALFFTQGYLLAHALQLSVGFVTVSYAVAVGGLVTLLPISISGLGTREAAIIAYLSTAGVPAETALSFSLLVFATFYIAGGMIGALAWWIKPVAFPALRELSSARG